MTFFGFRQKYYFNMVLVLVFKKNLERVHIFPMQKSGEVL